MINDKKEEVPLTKNWIQKFRGSNNLLIAVVAVAMLLDYMLLTTIVSIMPQYLYNLEHPDQPLEDAMNLTESRMTSKIEYPIFDTEESLNETSVGYAAANSSIPTHADLTRENVIVGIMYAAKPFLQIIANPFVGPLTNKIGYSIPMFMGVIILLTTTIAFAFAKGYAILFMARAFQGIGSSFIAVAGLGLLAQTFKDEQERGTAISIAFSGTCLGVLLGPPFGGAMYQFVGYASPFLVICGLLLCNGVLLLLIMPPTVTTSEVEGPSLRKLISDPYILIAAGTITIGNLGIAVLEPALPLWMIQTMGSQTWEQGAIFISSSVAYLIGAVVIGRVGHHVGRWAIALAALVLQALCLIAIPFAKNIYHLIIPNAGVGIAVGMVDNSMMPELGHLVDLRHASVYGTVFAIGNFAISSSYVLGPALSAALVNHIGFRGTLLGISILGLLLAPLLFFLRKPPSKEEMKALLPSEGVQLQATSECK